MSDPAGLALLAIFVLIFVCLIPQLVAQRKLAVQSRVHDRHSELSRVVTRPTEDRAKERPAGPSTAPLLSAPAWNTEGRSVMVRPPVNARHAKVKVDIPAPVKLTRAEAAKRRAIVAASLAALTLVGFGLLAFSALPLAVSAVLAAAPLTGLVVTIAFGRRAAIANAKADEAYLARLERRQQERAHPRPVSDKQFEDLAAPDEPKAPERPATPTNQKSGAPVVPVVEAREYVESDVWTPVEVPPPAYTMKAKAPRWLPEPLSIADLAGQAEETLSHTVISTGSGQQADEGPVVQYTDLDLNAIMERRRVV